MPAAYLTMDRGPGPALSQIDRFELSVRPSTSRKDCDTYIIDMSGDAVRGRRESDAEEWAAWFAAKRGPALLRRHGQRGVVVSELNFSKNQLGDAELEAVLRSVLMVARHVSSVKFHRNRMTRSDGVLNLVRRGLVHQVHLSHNLLSDAEMSRLVSAALDAYAPKGDEPLYPLPRGEALWLRMEHNAGHGGALTDAAIRAGGTRACHVSVQNGWTCTPFSCARHRRAPALHVTYLKTYAPSVQKSKDGEVETPSEQISQMMDKEGKHEGPGKSGSGWLAAATEDLRLTRTVHVEEQFPPLRPVRVAKEPTPAADPQELAALRPPPCPPTMASQGTDTLEWVEPPPGMEHVSLIRQQFVVYLLDVAGRL